MSIGVCEFWNNIVDETDTIVYISVLVGFLCILVKESGIADLFIKTSGLKSSMNMNFTLELVTNI